MENFAYIDKNVYINICMLILKKLKEYLLGVGIFKLIFCLFIILLSIIFAKRSKKKEKKINVYLQLNRNNTKNTKLVINDDKTYNDEEKTNDHHKEENEIENEGYHITHSSHIFDLKVISTTELCNVCNDNIYAFIFNKKNIFECVICKNKSHIECAPNSNLMSCKNSIFFKNKHKFIKIKNSLWNGKCDICNQSFSYFSFSIYGIKYIYKCIWCNKYFHGKCINKNIYKKINNNNDINTKNDDLICAYGNNKYILYPYEIFVKEKYLLYFLMQSYQKINKAQIKKDDILLNYNETQSENYIYEDELVVENEIDKLSIQMFESGKNRELIYFNYLNNAKKYQSLINSQITKNGNNNNNPIIDKLNHAIHINMLLNFLPIHIPIYEINTTNKFLLIFVNVRSGGQTGKNLYRELLMHFNPLQIINIENESSVINTLNMYKEMLYQKKVIIFLCGGDGTISIFIDTLIKFFYRNAPFNIYEENEKFPKKKTQKKKIYHITENSNKISNKSITFFNKYIMAASKVALKKSGNNTSKIILNNERDKTICDFTNNCFDTKKSTSLLENEKIYSLIEGKNNMNNACDDNNNNNSKIDNILLNNGTNIYSDLYKNYDDNSFINRCTKTEINSNASLSNESISYMSPFPNSDSMCNSFRKGLNNQKYINLHENVNIYKDKKEKDDIYIDQTLNNSHINKSIIENYNNNSYGYISGYSNNFIDINKPWNNNNSYIYSCSLKNNQTDSSIIYHDYKENDIKKYSIKYGNSSSGHVHSNYYRDDESSDTSESLDEEEKIQKKNKETQTKTKKWLKYISKESEKIHNKFIKRNINKIQERFNLNKSQAIESENSLYKFHKNGKNKYKIINKKKHKQTDSINDNSSKTSNNKYTVKSYIENTPIGIMPLGTGNDLCISLGWGNSYINNISLYLDKIKHSKNKLVDVWSIKAYDLSNNTVLNNTFINYFDIGLISRLALHFDNIRKQFPHFFNSRLGNKILYGEIGFRDFCFNTYKYKLNKHIKLYCDGKRVKINNDLESICFINIPYILGGHNIWKDDNLQYCYYSDIEKGYYDENEKDKIKDNKKLAKKVTKLKKKNMHNNKSTNTQIHTYNGNYENKLYTQSLKSKKNDSYNDENINIQREISKSCSYKCCDKMLYDEMKENIKHIEEENNTTDYSNIYKPHKLYLYKRKQNSQMYKKQQIDDKLIEVFGIKNIFHLVQVQLGLSSPVKLCQGHELFIKISKKFIQNNKMYFQYDGEPVFLKICKLHFTHKCQCLFLSPNSPIL
ncbi:diacylglycerol kinase, putative [Plasmodium berghei]|uniref:diacylglycerol kinase (ATP) n=2 Tax=Plasmodium berghei TaxID=5821 RepID=A0A509AIW8_PLABA|nr:diacylglycerol kinase, putative [Plasmodium berghei ANKA]CXI36211.1 diacylglycerol kinase, putative [Plasmodium berghei]SCM21570.1 diacylglycerol kinase, putative [Plasmodium berghei]SCN24767.1 diacylglycerol kinase, putative [Plasmodium berghei]SCO59902.1 diacylglycerol kinase, putative [Plasmodium berghei]SCO61239.1 diacylglycerol kinase, putative [Plasmodium berghei]|eukprot:XP_034421286.1 diacylglycerol kinase, putative [Plasmodium berghei ANKA]